MERIWFAVLVALIALPALAAEAQQARVRSSGWSLGPEGLGPGVSFIVVDRNPDIFHVRYPAGHTVGPHRHKSGESITVLSGTLLVGWGHVWDAAKLVEIRAGEKLEVPADVVHFSSAREETVMEVKVAGPYNIEYILDLDDPRQQKR